jgi:hypothetical protein
MRPFWADPANFPSSARIHPALTSFADEVCATVARLFVYVGALALIAILGVHFWQQLPQIVSGDDPPRAGWSVSDRSSPAFALNPTDPSVKSAAYTILRHPEGGRKDVLIWPRGQIGPGQGERPMAELEIYRLGGEGYSVLPPLTDLALRMPRGAGGSALEAAGVIDSKFGTVALLRRGGAEDGIGNCLGFFKGIDDPPLRISGWSCRGDGLPVRRSAIACMLDQLTLLGAGNEPKMVELFARAEPRRRSCAAAGGPPAPADWITEATNPNLRGAL